MLPLPVGHVIVPVRSRANVAGIASAGRRESASGVRDKYHAGVIVLQPVKAQVAQHGANAKAKVRYRVGALQQEDARVAQGDHAPAPVASYVKAGKVGPAGARDIESVREADGDARGIANARGQE